MAVSRVVFDGVQNFGEFFPQEHRYDCGRSFVGSQSVVVAGAGSGYSK